MSDTFLVRDVFNPFVVRALSERFYQVDHHFDKKGFENYIIPRLPDLSYSERLQLIAEAHEEFLPKDFPAAAEMVVAALPEPFQSDVLDRTNDRFIVASHARWVGKNGLEHFPESMKTLKAITKCLTAEWGIRPFLIKYPERTLQQLHKWATDSNPHVRRLVSEGSRPHLPWAMKLKWVIQEPQKTIALLEKLQDDPSEYVRRSVANHLNDHAKKHPDLVVQTLQRWQQQNLTKDKQRMIRHALRSLLKSGHSGALALMGFSPDAKIRIENLQVPEEVTTGDTLAFHFDIVSEGKNNQPLMIDYVIYFQKANGNQAPKVFKLTTKTIAAGARLSFSKKQSFKVITTRKYYPGTHRLAIQVNGRELGERAFELLDSTNGK